MMASTSLQKVQTVNQFAREHHHEPATKLGKSRLLGWSKKFRFTLRNLQIQEKVEVRNTKITQ